MRILILIRTQTLMCHPVRMGQQRSMCISMLKFQLMLVRILVLTLILICHPVRMGQQRSWSVLEARTCTYKYTFTHSYLYAYSSAAGACWRLVLIRVCIRILILTYTQTLQGSSSVLEAAATEDAALERQLCGRGGVGVEAHEAAPQGRAPCARARHAREDCQAYPPPPTPCLFTPTSYLLPPTSLPLPPTSYPLPPTS